MLFCSFLKEESKLDILINNAGLAGPDRILTVDGNETTLQVNHLSHFLLTNLLLEILKKSSPSRIINVSSLGHKWGKINREDLQLEHNFGGQKAYVQSKLANVLFTRELARRLENTGVVANSLHPGAVKTDIFRTLTFFKRIILYFFYCIFKNAKSGAQTTLAIALDPDFEQITGKYFADCKVKKESKLAQDDDTADWLWRTSEKLTGLDK